VCGISREISLVTRKRKDSSAADWTHQRIWKDTSQTAYIAGLHLDSNGRVHLSYGSSDIDARLLTMGVADVEGLFDGEFDCSASQVLDNGSGQPMAWQLGVAAAAGAAGGAALAAPSSAATAVAAGAGAAAARSSLQSSSGAAASAARTSSSAAAAVEAVQSTLAAAGGGAQQQQQQQQQQQLSKQHRRTKEPQQQQQKQQQGMPR
jgi:hypothetical protein